MRRARITSMKGNLFPKHFGLGFKHVSYLSRPAGFPPFLLFGCRPAPQTPAIPCNIEQGSALAVKPTYEAGWPVVGGLVLQACNHLQYLFVGSILTELQCHSRITAALEEFECSVSFTVTVYVDVVSCVLNLVKLVLVHSASYDHDIAKEFTSLQMGYNGGWYRYFIL